MAPCQITDKNANLRARKGAALAGVGFESYVGLAPPEARFCALSVYYSIKSHHEFKMRLPGRFVKGDHEVVEKALAAQENW